jgi:hypothetical protein
MECKWINAASSRTGNISVKYRKIDICHILLAPHMKEFVDISTIMPRTRQNEQEEYQLYTLERILNTMKI